MPTVNMFILENLIAPLGGTADMDDEKATALREVDGNNESDVKNVLYQEIKPYYDSRSNDHKISIKRSLSYYLTTDKVDFGRMYDSVLIAFGHPTNPKDFFIWIWEILFPKEKYNLDNLNQYIEIEDINEANNYL